MKVKIKPSTCSGSITIPPSKSMAHRAIICASLTNGHSVISNVDYSQDILATIQGMRKLGAVIKQDGHTLHIDGICDFQHIKDTHIHCKESGSTLRFFIPIFPYVINPSPLAEKEDLCSAHKKYTKKSFKNKVCLSFKTMMKYVYPHRLNQTTLY